MATKKAGGSTKNGRDSIGKRRGLKRNHDQLVLAGNILVRQLGCKFWAGDNVQKGRDDTLFATATGIMQISKRPHQDPRLKNKRVMRRYIEVLKHDDVA